MVAGKRQQKVRERNENIACRRNNESYTGSGCPAWNYSSGSVTFHVDITGFYVCAPVLKYNVYIYYIYRTGICPCIKIYCTHWIKYGNGKVIIKRARKDYVNGRPAGKWEIGEEEFLLEDLDSCGMSLPVLERYVEFNPIMKNGNSEECFFQLKNGKRLGCEMKFYLQEDLDELFRYIYEEAGIEFQETSGQALGSEKETEYLKAGKYI